MAFAVVRYLVEHAGGLVSQNEILEAVWPNTFVQPEVLKSQILDIRRALWNDSKNPRFIETLPKRGYQFIARVGESSTPTDLEVQLPPSKLVGRNEQLDLLRNCLQKGLANRRQIVFMIGISRKQLRRVVAGNGVIKMAGAKRRAQPLYGEIRTAKSAYRR